jgi:hypothetical protein
MTTIQAVMLGAMLWMTPSLVLLAFLIWREGLGLVEKDSAGACRVVRDLKSAIAGQDHRSIRGGLPKPAALKNPA